MLQCLVDSAEREISHRELTFSTGRRGKGEREKKKAPVMLQEGHSGKKSEYGMDRKDEIELSTN